MMFLSAFRESKNMYAVDLFLPFLTRLVITQVSLVNVTGPGYNHTASFLA